MDVRHKQTGVFFRILAGVLLCAMLVFLTACGTRLPAPTGVNVDQISLTLSWNPVSAAAYYTVRIEGGGQTKEVDSGKNSYPLETLGEGEYTLRVKAVAAGAGGYSDSAWSAPLSFIREHETGLTFRQIESNTAFEVSGVGTAEGDIVIPDTYRGLPVTRIGDRAFFNKNTITSATLGKNIGEIGAQAFANCSLLKDVRLPEGLRSIGTQAFQSCRALTAALVIPDSVTEIGAQAFEYCRELPSVTFGSGIESIGDSAFNGCSALTEAVLPDNVKTLGDGAFSACSALERISLGSGITAIGANTFRGCDALSAVTVGGGVLSVGDRAFAECASLASVTLSDSILTIGEEAFAECPVLSDVSLGKGIEKISHNAFRETKLFETSGAVYVGNWFLGTNGSVPALSLREDTVGIADYAFENFDNFDYRLDIPESVVHIGESAFENRKTLTNVILGGGVQTIGERAFADCTGLAVVIAGATDESGTALGESALRSIGSYAFSGCTTLQSMETPDSLEHVGTYAFRESGLWNNAEREVYAGNWLVECRDNDIHGPLSFHESTVGIADYALYQCNFITTAYIPDSVRYIGRSAFYECDDLAAVTLPAGLTVIEDYTFYGCKSLTGIELPSALERIGRSAFYKCALGSPATDSDHDELVIPENVLSIGDYAFYDCGFSEQTGEETQTKLGIDSVVIGSSVQSIGNYAFANMQPLKSVILGNGVKTIGERAFYKCENLVDVVFGSSLASIGERAFYGCTSLTAVRLPETLSSIGDYAFYRCSSLEEAQLGSAERIGDYAFFGCTSLTRVEFPAPLVSIGKQAFRNCSSLVSVRLRGTIENIGAHAFYGCNALTVYSDAEGEIDGWNMRWNSSYRPVVWGCTFSDEGYLISFELTQTSVSNLSMATALSAPLREGFTFAGWSDSESGDAIYSLNGLSDVSSGTRLYAVWTPAG